MKYKQLYMKKKRKKLYNDFSNNNYLLNKRLNVCKVDNGIILPTIEDSNKLWGIGGVLNSDGEFVEESSSGYLFGGKYEFDEKFVDYIDEEVVFFGPFIKHWGHFICDEISRLWYMLDNPKKYRIAYCGFSFYYGPSYIAGNYLELLELLGIESSQLINIQKPTRFKKIIIPDFSFAAGKFYTKEFLAIVDKITSNVNVNIDNCPENVYFSRLSFGSSSDKELGEEKIVRLLKEKKYTVLSPEKLTFKEQIYYLNHCKNICMISGSISHNIMFSRTKNQVIILNKTDMTNNYQMVIDHIASSNIIYVDVYKKIFPVLFGMGPFLMYVSKYLKKWLNIKGHKGSIKIKDYVWYLKRYHIIYKNEKNRELLKMQINTKK